MTMDNYKCRHCKNYMNEYHRICPICKAEKTLELVPNGKIWLELNFLVMTNEMDYKNAILEFINSNLP